MSRQIQETITVDVQGRPERPVYSFRNPFHRRAFVSDTHLQLTVEFSQFGGIEFHMNQIKIARQDPGSLAQYKTFTIRSGTVYLNEGDLIEIYAWVPPGPARSARFSFTFTISDDPVDPGISGAPRSLFETNQELSVPVGGLDQDTLDLLAELGKIRANIGAQKITIDRGELDRLVGAAITAIMQPDPSADSIRDRVGQILALVGNQELANDIPAIIQQLEGLLNAINSNEIEVKTDTLEELIGDLTHKTVADDFGITDVLQIVSAPAPAPAQAPLKAIKEVVDDLLGGFNLQELKRAISTLKTQIPLYEAAAPDQPDLAQQLKLFRMRLERASETIPDPLQTESGALFPKRVYSPGTHTNVINSKGHTHFIASMVPFMAPEAAVQTLSETGARLAFERTVIPPTHPDYLEPEPRIDTDQTPTRTWIFDTGNSTRTKRPVFRFRIGQYGQIGTGDFTNSLRWHFDMKYETSNTHDFSDVIDTVNDHNLLLSYNPRLSVGGGREGQNLIRVATPVDKGGWDLTTIQRFTDIFTYNRPETTARYYRISITMKYGAPYLSARTFDDDMAGTREGISFIDAIDSLHLTGYAALSFEFRDEFGNWFPAITDSETGGAYRQGQTKIFRFSEAVYQFPLPAGGDIFRARLDVWGGTVGLGISMILLS